MTDLFYVFGIALTVAALAISFYGLPATQSRAAWFPNGRAAQVPIRHASVAGGRRANAAAGSRPQLPKVRRWSTKRTMADDEHASRLMDLEIKIAYLEKFLFELDGVVREQATLLARVAAQVEHHRTQLSSDTATGPADDKPPHY